MLKLAKYNSILCKIAFLAIISLDCYAFSNSYYKYGSKDVTYNIFGESGLVVIPIAKSKPEGTVNFHFSNNEIFKYGALSVNPFNWLEATYFYYRPKDLIFGSSSNIGKYLDKGFSVKFSRRLNEELSIAAGLSDFAGTGLFTREYIISSFEKNWYRLSLGIGYGKFATGSGFTNPIGIILPEYKTRPTSSSNRNLGGSPSYDLWFRGRATLIGGAELFLSGALRNITIKIDYDEFDYINDFSAVGNLGQNYALRKKDSNFNFGIEYPINNSLNFSLSFLKGNTLNFGFTFGGNFSKPFFKKKLPSNQLESSKKGLSKKERFYEDLIFNLKRKQIFLQSVETSDNDVKVAVSSSKYRNPIILHAIVGETTSALQKEHSMDIDMLSTIGINVGKELYRVSTPLDLFEERQNQYLENIIFSSLITEGKNQDFQTFYFQPTFNFPASFTGMTPTLVNHIGDPQQFYYGGLALRLDNELQLSRSFMINTEIFHILTDNFDEKGSYPDSSLPHVRTEIVNYLQDSNTYIGRMQFDYFSKPLDNLYTKISGGILEDMFGGFGFEVLYKPFKRNYSFGIDFYRVKQRDFDRKFNFQDYKINTGHLNFNYYFPHLEIMSNLSYGYYLAGDKGFTLDISRRLKSGFRAGIFFTRTNVSAELFGEGSFDKGFYFQIPVDLFLNDYRGGYINFKLRPLTRDGGQKLEAGNDLASIMHDTSFSEIYRNWRYFND